MGPSPCASLSGSFSGLGEYLKIIVPSCRDPDLWALQISQPELGRIVHSPKATIKNHWANICSVQLNCIGRIWEKIKVPCVLHGLRREQEGREGPRAWALSLRWQSVWPESRFAHHHNKGGNTSLTGQLRGLNVNLWGYEVKYLIHGEWEWLLLSWFCFS